MELAHLRTRAKLRVSQHRPARGKMTTLTQLLERARAEIEEIDARAAERAVERGASLLDVREPSETDDGHIPGATLVPRGLLELRLEGLAFDPEATIVVCCASGTRSLLAASTLRALGYPHAVSLRGGFDAWKRADLPVHIPTGFSPTQRARYSRHVRIPEVGDAGQQRLLTSKALIVGAGGLGSPVAYYLAAAGVGTLSIVDSDVVDRSNLQRQILHADHRVGMPKVDSARETLEALNPDVRVETHHTRLTAENVEALIDGHDVVVDCADNFATRYLINDACVRLGVPNVTGSVYRFEGQVMVVMPHEGPCYRCLFPEPPPPEATPSCDEAGVLGVLPGTIGLVQATEVIKLLLGVGRPLVGRVLLYDALEQRFRELQLDRDEGCATCGVGDA